MAANWSCTRLRKRFVNHISTPSSSLPIFRRNVHASVYDKNVEENVRPTVVPDEVIGSQTDNYWAPNPYTGVFGPPTEHNPLAIKDHKLDSSPANSVDSVLDQKAFFRPLEDLDKPHYP